MRDNCSDEGRLCPSTSRVLEGTRNCSGGTGACGLADCEISRERRRTVKGLKMLYV